MRSILWTVICVLFILWVLGLVMNFGGPLIHLVIVVAVILVTYNILTRGKFAL